MAPRRKKSASTGVTEEIRARHAWLELLQTSGPFLALPVVHEALPNGLTEVPKETRALMRVRVEQMMSDGGVSRRDVVHAVLHNALDWQDSLLLDDGIPASLAVAQAGLGTPLRPDFAFRADVVGRDEQDTDGEDDEDTAEEEADGEEPDAKSTGAADGLEDEDLNNPWKLLGTLLPWGQHPLDSRGGASSPVDRLAALLRARRVPIGVATDGRWWAVVWAPIGGSTGVGIWDASLFSAEPDLFAAFVDFLGRFRFLNAELDKTLPRLLRASLSRQEEVTETLGRQVRDAVELLVARFDQLDRDSEGDLLRDVSDDDFYSGVVTVMMRVVFLLFAEERRLLPSDDDLYASGYSVGYLVEQLRTREKYAGQQALAHRTAAWHRLLAVTRAIHAGVAHEDLRMPAYGGELFDPDRYPWLEGRVATTEGTTPSHMDAEPPAVDDLTVLKMLEAVQFVTIDGATRQLTFRSLDVEQIGYVYEGLLELEVRTAEETMVGLARPAKWPSIKGAEVKQLTCEVPLADVVAKHAELDDVKFASWLSEYTVWKAQKIQTELAKPIKSDQLDDLGRMVGSGTQDFTHAESLLPVIRLDHRGWPAVTPKGGRYVTRSSRRASSGTHYTPRRLAEEVVKHALDPLVHRPGPLQTGDEDAWELRPSAEILTLRVADIAMGSGAFLVAACRYLAGKLVRAWELEGRRDALLAAETRHGNRLAADSEVDAIQLEARRLIAERCLFGVDINPLAVSMAKLSMWLITMDRERPFGFLDDRFTAGDSLLGLTSFAQLEVMHIDPAAGRRLKRDTMDFSEEWRAVVQKAATLRRRITTTPVVTIRDVEHKARLLNQSREVESSLSVVADALTGVGLKGAQVTSKKRDNLFVQLALTLATTGENTTSLRSQAETDLFGGQPAGTSSRTPLHWPLAFPEVFGDTTSPGFDAIIGNPPFLGGKKISAPLGGDYLKWLQQWDGNGVSGSADLATRFVLRAEKLLNRHGQLGLVTNNSVTENVSLKVGLEQATRSLHLWRGVSGHPWPTKSANLQIVEFWASREKPGRSASLWLDGEQVPSIGPDLEVPTTIPGRPVVLRENEDLAFQGSNIVGIGFTLTEDERNDLIAKNPRNAEVIQPYTIGKDLSQRRDCSSSRHVINFNNRPFEKAEEYPELLNRVRQLVKPKRDQSNRKQYRENWWRFAERAIELYEAIDNLEYVLAMSQVGNTLMPARVKTGPVFGHACVVFALDDFAHLALLSSSAHSAWVMRYTSTMRTDIRYSSNAVFLTLPRPRAHERPVEWARLEHLGKQLDTTRRALMLSRGWGMTTAYNKVRDSSVADPEVVALRALHTEIDHAVLAAYGWTDLDPKVGFHETKIGVRWTMERDVKYEVIDRLRTLNQERFDAQPK
ncbi:Eco57I restriction-modification methylase domain-containing protein [Streptomyces sp. NPDC059175]|uniref:Eco57I restriction-modification methylase domain-containing protein n=1 Tax=Streptomyces sp. NPDC059175 TaxID=3346757 RepID=UPI0036A123D3